MTAGTSERVVRVAVAGCGTVGGALIDLLARHGDAIARRRGARFEVVRVLVRDGTRPRSAAVPRELVTEQLAEFLATDCDVVVEAIGGTTVAAAIARGTLARGRRLVTANKALLRAEGPALAAVARAHAFQGAALDFEAAVGGGVPVVRALRESLAGHGVRAVRGVLNGTTNYILSRLELGASFADALAEAQRAGFAEADPSRDLDGLDAADKIAVLAWLAFGVDPTALTVHTAGLGDDIAHRVRHAQLDGRVIRLVAQAELRDGVVCASVAPLALDPAHPLARVRDEENVVLIESESAGIITLHGRGAGGEATASAVLADLLRAVPHVSHLPTPV
jgi:homoserine dehydrogenase